MSITDDERLQTIDLVGGTSNEEDVLWALNYLLNLPDDDEEWMFRKGHGHDG